MNGDKQQKASFRIAEVPAEFISNPPPNKSLEDVGLPLPVVEALVALGCYIP